MKKINYIKATLKTLIFISVALFVVQVILIFLCFRFECFYSYLIGNELAGCEKSFLCNLLTYKSSEELFGAFIGLMAALISVAIPITVSNVADALKPYNDKEIHQMFMNEPKFKNMLLVVIILAVALIIWFFFSTILLVGFILLMLSIITLLAFYSFIERALEYITATDDVVWDYYKEKTKKLFEDGEK